MHDDDNRTVTIIPAAPGYMVVWVDDLPEGDEPHIAMCDPVIAWQVETTTIKSYVKGVLEQRTTHSFASPITMEGSQEESPYWGIKRPDGLYEVPGSATYRTFAEFNAAQLERQRGKNS